MKKQNYIRLAAVIAIIALSSAVYAAPSKTRDAKESFTVPASALEVVPNIFALGEKRDVDGTLVEGYVIVHPKREYARGRGGAAKPASTVCYSFLAKDTRWKTAEPYLLNTANTDGMSDAFVSNTVALGINEWEKYVTRDIFGVGSATTSPLSAETSAPDGLNEVFFGSLADPNTIAVTIVWGIFGGPIANRELREWDMVYNNAFSWGDVASTLDTSLMDLQNITVHELGHAAGLGHPSDSCVNETMYRFADYGETKKRDLNAGDIAGIQKLYR